MSMANVNWIKYLKTLKDPKVSKDIDNNYCAMNRKDTP